MSKDKLLRNEKLRTITIERAHKFISREEWMDINLYSKIYAERKSIDYIMYYSPPFKGPNNTDACRFSDIDHNSFHPAEIGQTFGPSWSSHWFRLEFEIPKEWKGQEVHLLWDNGSEGLIFDVYGEPLQGLYGGNGDDKRGEFILTMNSEGGERYIYFIEMACTGLFGNPGPDGFLSPPSEDKTFTLSQAEIAVLDKDVWDIFWDFDVVLGMAEELHEESNRAWQASATLERVMNVCYPGDRSTYPETKAILTEFLSATNGSSQHTVTSTGHCHIDTAWLWPYSETRRKCARSWSSQITYMEKYPNHIFVASQAQQHDWMKSNYPGLFERMKEEAKNGRFIPVGGTWVEMDCNIPSGESFIRQFLYGQNFFEEEYGILCSEFWLPDTFGYSSQLPQIIRGSSIDFFLTQKLSWNLINKFPHNTFVWQGPDGSQVISHFPPADTYCSNASVKDVNYTVTNFKNKGTSNNSLLLFGLGDGGGGPQMKMLERLERMKNLDGLPKVEMRTPFEFFKRIREEIDGPIWSGELYFELHQGTYTTHAAVKKGNRKNEFLLRLAEFVSTFRFIVNGAEYPQEELERLWKLLLLNQFHDVIPGTSIGHVYKDTREHYEDIQNSASDIIQTSYNDIISGEGDTIFLNTLSWPRKELVKCNNEYKIASVGPFGFYNRTYENFEEVQAREENGHYILENQFLKVKFNSNGELISVWHKKTERESLEDGKVGNQFVLFDDVPFFWDAWDVMIYHKDKRRDVSVSSISLGETGPLRASVEISLEISENSTITQTVSIDAVSEYVTFDTKVEWGENRKFLKVEFPVNVSSDTADYSVQFANVSRPTHTNTSDDMAKYEVCGHHWADLSEYGFGVALLNDCKYGYACEGNTIRLSLLRSPKRPDDDADMGTHHFKYALYPHVGNYQECNLVRTGYNFNVPIEVVGNSTLENYLNQPLFSVDAENIVLETLKKAERSNNIILRVWESLGGRGSATISSCLPLKSVARCNLIERNEKPGKKFDDPSGTYEAVELKDNNFTFEFGPYSIHTFTLQC